MNRYIGDFTPGKTLRLTFNTNKADGTPITLAGSPVVSVYKDANTVESVAGVTLAVDFDARTGLHQVAVDTSADGAFYAAGSDFRAVITAGTVDAVSVVGVVVGGFSLANRSALRPTVADKTLDVSAGGEAGLDWANVGSPATALNLSGTTVGTATALGGLPALPTDWVSAAGVSAAAVTKVQAGLSTYSGGPVASVAAPVTVGTNGDKTGYSLAVAPPTAAAIANAVLTDTTDTGTAGSLGHLVTTAPGWYTAPPASDITAIKAKTDNLPANPAAVGSAMTVSDKTGFILAAAGLDAVVVETGVNARQALSPILAACAGVVIGAGTGTVILKGGDVSTTRITATTDSAGNRSSVALNLPT